MQKIQLERCYRLFDVGYSLITVGQNKRPNYSWKRSQTEPLDRETFTKQYNYAGGYVTKDGHEMEATAGVGMVTGYNGLEVIDVDLKVFSSLPEQQAFWDELHSFLKDNIDDFDLKFVIYKTKNQGYHILYRCATVQGNTKLAKLQGHREAVIETRGIGGYVFIYDNKINLSYNEIQTISENDREILWKICRTFNHVEEEPTPTQKEYTESAVTPWDDYNAKVSIFDVISDDFKIVRKTSERIIIKRHGGDSAHSGYVFTGSGCMYLFSTATQYPHEKLLSPYAAYTWKHHGGNFKNSAKQLYADGYGTRLTKPAPKPVERPAMTFNEADAVFPIDIFPAGIKDYMIQCHDYLNHSYDYMGSSMLWLLSVIIGNSMRLEVKRGWVEIATVWISIIGKAGIGKTPSIDAVIFPILEQNSREIKRYIELLKKHAEYEALTKEEKEYHEVIPEPKKTQFVANDITLEALVDLHQENKNAVGVFKDELNGWFKDMNKYRVGSDLEFWLSTWSGKAVAFNRKQSRSSFVDKPIIPVMGGIQPGVLASMFTAENKDNGFVDRMLLSFPELAVNMYNENEVSTEIIQWYRDTILSLFEFIKFRVCSYSEDGEIEPYKCQMTPSARKEWVRIFNEITTMQNSDDENEYTKSMLPKQKSYIPRFAMLINTLDCFIAGHRDDEYLLVSKESMLKAERLSRYFIAMAKKIRIDTQETNDLKTSISQAKTKNPKELFNAMYEENPNLNKASAAELLGVSRQQIYNWIKCKVV